MNKEKDHQARGERGGRGRESLNTNERKWKNKDNGNKTEVEREKQINKWSDWIRKQTIKKQLL